jgi:hypothetical protein
VPVAMSPSRIECSICYETVCEDNIMDIDTTIAMGEPSGLEQNIPFENLDPVSASFDYLS